MAQGLRCPHCGHKHPVAELDGAPTFTCSGCGQVLKTPREYRAPVSPPPAAPARTPRVPDPPSVPRSSAAPRARETPRARPTAPVVGSAETAVMPRATVPPRDRAAPAPPEPSLDRSAGLPWPWRVLVWVVAVPLGLLIVAIPARWIGVLNGNSFFDVVSGTGMGRYLRIFSIAPFAALVIATIAHVALEQLPEWLARRRALAREAAQLRQPAPSTRPAAQRAGRASGRRTS